MLIEGNNYTIHVSEGPSFELTDKKIKAHFFKLDSIKLDDIKYQAKIKHIIEKYWYTVSDILDLYFIEQKGVDNLQLAFNLRRHEVFFQTEDGIVIRLQDGIAKVQDVFGYNQQKPSNVYEELKQDLTQTLAKVFQDFLNGQMKETYKLPNRYFLTFGKSKEVIDDIKTFNIAEDIIKPRHAKFLAELVQDIVFDVMKLLGIGQLEKN